MVHELLSYRRHTDPRTGNETMEAWRTRDHDDLVFCLSMVCWWGERLDPWQFAALDLRRGSVPKPGRYANMPDQSVRPKLWSARTFADELPPEVMARVSPQEWDAVKRATAAGEIRRDQLPSPWIP
jgi:hypothetical protein